MKRLLLISPLSRGSLMGGEFFFRLPLLGLLKVAALTPPGWHVSIVDEKVEPLDLEQDADLVGVTAMTTTAYRGYEIADAFRARGIPVVMGGMYPSRLPHEALAHADAVVVGEAEGLWAELLADVERGGLRRLYRHGQEFPSMARLPLPDWNLYRGKRYLPVHFVETTRGCPHHCEFCAVTDAFGGRYRNRPVDDVVTELRGLQPFEGRFILRNCVFFVDDNIYGNRAHARALLERIRDLGLKWFGHASTTIARDEPLLRLCRDSGCVALFLGFETLSPETLRSIGKAFNRPDRYLDTVNRLHDHGIGVDGSFVFGLDGDGEEVFDATLEFALKAKLDIGYFSILTPYPGTRLYQRLETEGRLLTRDWRLYDSSHVVYRPARLTPEQLVDGYRRVLEEFYTVPSIVRRLWGTGTYKNFFYPMNLGFRRSARALRLNRLPLVMRDSEVQSTTHRNPA